MTRKFPKRTPQHKIGDRAPRVFNHKIPNSWTANPSGTDYGWDVLVTISRNEEVREDFFVQLKGSESPNYIDNEEFVSVRWKFQLSIFLLQTNSFNACYM
jgi:hypothetical protein